MSEGKYRIAVRGLVFNEGRFLLLKRSKPARGQLGYWELPGGGLDFGESPIEALKRELIEETTLEVEVKYPICTWHYHRGDQVQIIGMTFACHMSQGQVQLSDEHEDFAWIEYPHLDNYMVFPELLEEMAEWDWPYLLKIQGA